MMSASISVTFIGTMNGAETPVAIIIAPGGSEASMGAARKL